MNSFGNNLMFFLYVWDQSSNIVINTCITYDKNGVLVNEGILVDVFELRKLIFNLTFAPL